MYKTYQTKTNIERILHNEGRGRREYIGFLHNKGTYKAEIINIADYFDTKC